MQLPAVRSEHWQLLFVKCLITLIVFVNMPVDCKGSNKDRPPEQQLLNDLFNDSNYSKLARPAERDAHAVEVKFGISLQEIVNVDERKEELHTNLWLNYEWKDYRLAWEKTEYDGVNSIRVPSDLVWTPDILLYNAASGNVDNLHHTPIVVYSDGTCNWVPLGLHSTSCGIDVSWFPYDQQICNLKFGSWTHDGSKLNLTSREDRIDVSNYNQHGEWSLIEAAAQRNVQQYECCPEPYIDIIFTITIRRRPLFFVVNLIVPCALLSFLALLTFFLPPDCNERISLGIVILLVLAIFSLILTSAVPATSMAVPLIHVYFMCMMFMCAFSLIMAVLVLNMHHRNPNIYRMPNWFRKVVCQWLASAVLMSQPRKETSQKTEMQDMAESRTAATDKLIPNGQDVDDASPLNDAVGSGTHGLAAILDQLRLITQKVREVNEASEGSNDWKFAAIVIDRLCIVVFTVCMIIASLAILLSSPYK